MRGDEEKPSMTKRSDCPFCGGHDEDCNFGQPSPSTESGGGEREAIADEIEMHLRKMAHPSWTMLKKWVAVLRSAPPPAGPGLREAAKFLRDYIKLYDAYEADFPKPETAILKISDIRALVAALQQAGETRNLTAEESRLMHEALIASSEHQYDIPAELRYWQVWPQDEQYAENLLDDLNDDHPDNKTIVAQWLRKVRVEGMRAGIAASPELRQSLQQKSGASAGPSTLAVKGTTTDAASRRGEPDPSPPAGGETFAWVIEAAWTPASEPKYLVGFEGEGDGMVLHWSQDPFKAIRFSRQKDAKSIARSFVDRDSKPAGYRIAEHGFAEVAALARPAEKPVADLPYEHPVAWRWRWCDQPYWDLRDTRPEWADEPNVICQALYAAPQSPVPSGAEGK